MNAEKPLIIGGARKVHLALQSMTDDLKEIIERCEKPDAKESEVLALMIVTLEVVAAMSKLGNSTAAMRAARSKLDSIITKAMTDDEP